MHGKTLTIALSISILGAPAFAAVGSQAALQVHAAVNASFANGQAVKLGDAPAAGGARLIQVADKATEKNVATFKDAADLVAQIGEAHNFSTGFCQRFEINCGGQPWPVRYKTEGLQTENRLLSIGKASGVDTVVVSRQDANKARAELYISDVFGNLIRGYVSLNNQAPTRLAPDQARIGFESEKKWWMANLPGNAVTADASAAK